MREEIIRQLIRVLRSVCKRLYKIDHEIYFEEWYVIIKTYCLRQKGQPFLVSHKNVRTASEQLRPLVFGQWAAPEQLRLWREVGFLNNIFFTFLFSLTTRDILWEILLQIDLVQKLSKVSYFSNRDFYENQNNFYQLSISLLIRLTNYFQTWYELLSWL